MLNMKKEINFVSTTSKVLHCNTVSSIRVIIEATFKKHRFGSVSLAVAMRRYEFRRCTLKLMELVRERFNMVDIEQYRESETIKNDL